MQSETISPIWRGACVLSALALMAYFNSLSAGFVFDDLYFVQEQYLRNPFNSELILNRPVIALSLSFNYYLDGAKPRGFHFVNLLVHIAAAIVLFDLVRRLLTRPNFAERFAGRAEKLALLIAALWMLHPLQTQSVTYMIQRCESMMGLFYLSAILAMVRYAETGQNRWIFGSYLAVALSAGCKEVAATIPLTCLLLDRAFLSSGWRETLRLRWAYYLGLFLCTGLAIICTVFLRGAIFTGAGAAGFGVSLYTPVTYALTQTHVVLYYLRLCFWPSPLCLDYLDWPIKKSLAEAWTTAIPLALIVLTVTVTMLIRPRWGTVPFLFFLVLAPTSTIMPIQDAVFEHRLYLSLAAFVASVVLLLDRVLAKVSEANPEAGLGLTRLATLVAIVALGLCIGRTASRNNDYQSMFSIYADVVAKRPNNFRGHSNLGWAFLYSGQYELARKHAAIALSYQPGNSNYIHGMAAALYESGELDQAYRLVRSVKNIAEASAITPEIPLSVAKIAIVLGKTEEALQYLAISKQTMPTDARNHQFEGMAYLQLGQLEKADEAFARLIKAAPNQVRDWKVVARSLAMAPNLNRTQMRIARLSIEAACHITKNQDFECLDTLAIVLANEASLTQTKAIAPTALIGATIYKPSSQAASLFQKAADLAGQAAKLAQAKGQSYQAERILLRQKLFASGKRYTD